MGALYSIHTLALKGPVPRGLPLLLRKPQKASEEGTTAARATRPRTTPALGAEKKRAILGSGLCVMCVVGGMLDSVEVNAHACLMPTLKMESSEERQGRSAPSEPQRHAHPPGKAPGHRATAI